MPLYEYECSKCHERFEHLIVWYRADDVKCPKCGANAIRRVSSFKFNNYPVRGARASYNGKVLWER